MGVRSRLRPIGTTRKPHCICNARLSRGMKEGRLIRKGEANSNLVLLPSCSRERCGPQGEGCRGVTAMRHSLPSVATKVTSTRRWV